MFESVTYANMYLRENLNLKIPKDSRQVGLAARRSKSHKAPPQKGVILLCRIFAPFRRGAFVEDSRVQRKT